MFAGVLRVSGSSSVLSRVTATYNDLPRGFFRTLPSPSIVSRDNSGLSYPEPRLPYSLSCARKRTPALRNKSFLSVTGLLPEPSPAARKLTCKMSTSPAVMSAAALDAVKAAGLLKSEGLIGGKWVGADSGKTLQVLNPATNEVVTAVPLMGYAESERAVKAAHDAFQSWSKVTPKERSIKLRAWYDLIVSNREVIAKLMTLEQGKPVHEALGEVDYGAGYVEFYAEEAKRAYGDILPAPFADRRIIVIRQVAPALAAGCTVVIKPAELTPLCCFAMAELARQAGIPDGVLNVVTGDAKAIGRAILDSPLVAKLSFTGSTGVGKTLMAGAAETVKKVALELGGNAPFIVFDDADLDIAVAGAMACKFRNSGQTCICVNRFLIQDGIYDKFAEKFVEKVKELKVGNGLEEGVKQYKMHDVMLRCHYVIGCPQGPLINQMGVDKVKRHVDDAVSKGAKVLAGGKAHALGGTWWEPTVLSEVHTDAVIHREEVFGPVAPLFRFKTEEEAIKMANDTEFGLASYLYTSNIARGWRVMEALEYGMVGWNEAAISTEFAPFGGVKQSGHGREGSKYGLAEYMEMKYCLLGNLK